MRQAVVLATLVLGAPASAGGAQQSVESVVQASRGGVVTILAVDSNGESTGSGSGFFAGSSGLVTSLHVVEGAAWVEVYQSDSLLGSAPFALAVNSVADLALLPIAGIGLPIVREEPQLGERVVLIGAPRGLDRSVSTGVISAFRENDGARRLQLTAPASPGSSGSPVLNLRGQVIGVVTSSIDDAQNVNFAVPSAQVLDLLERPHARIVLGELGEPWWEIRARERRQRGGWTYLSTSVDGEEYFLDYSRVRGSPEGTRIAWIRVEYPTFQELGQLALYNAEERVEEFDCSLQRARALQAVFYHDNVRLEGGVRGDTGWTFALLGSVGEGLLNAVCSVG